MIRLDNISIDYTISSGKKLCAVENANADFPAEKISALLGPSGCGKTSLLHLMTGLLKASSGEVFINEKKFGGTRKSTSIIFQDFGLLPWKTVYANAELPLKIIGMKKNERKNIVRSLLEELSLHKNLNLYPSQLSGGMKQRLAIARALMSEPDLLLMDEPFSSLDALTRESAQNFLLEITGKRNISTIIVTHSIDEAVFLADRIYVMTGKNPGTINQCIDLPDRNKKDFRNDVRFQEYCAFIRNTLKNENDISDKEI
jgi:NitT/TauT family transport system ATP-binding protein